MYDYPNFDGTQACLGATPAAAAAFSGAIGADPAPALALCAACSFGDECRDWALTHDVYGVWGKTTEAGRTELRDKLQLSDPSSITDELDELVIAMRPRVVDDDPILAGSS